MKEIIFGKIRIQLISKEIIRIEKEYEDHFEDRDTFFVPDRNFCKEELPYSLKERKDCTHILFSDYDIRIRKNARGMSAVSIYRGRTCVYRYHNGVNQGELPSYSETPEIYAVYDKPRIIVPPYGYHAEKKEDEYNGYLIQKDADDIYLIFAGNDPRRLRRAYLDLTGRPELLRLSAFGCWNSKYYAYTQKEAEDIIRDYQSHDVPLDNVVIDTDWREMSSGIGYDVNTQLFPDMKAYFDFAHQNNIEIMFNDHPEPQPGATSVLSPTEIAFREEKLKHFLSLGLDYWWYDRNWSTKLISPDGFIHPETWGMYLFHDITAHEYQREAKGKAPRRVGVMANADNIANGTYFGIQNTASHRYPFQWTGDIGSGSESLYQNIENVLLAGENCIPYVHPDCGGHTGNPDKELYIRWMQIGTFLPVFRPHCTNTVIRTREPWQYDEETTDIVRESVKRRYRLLPMFYASAYQSYLDGNPLDRRILDEYPKEKAAEQYPGEFLFGNLLVAYPDYEKARELERHPLSSQHFLTSVHATFYEGREPEGTPLLETKFDNIDFNSDGTPFAEGLPVYDFSCRMETDIRLDKDRALAFVVDDGIRVRVDGEPYCEDWTCHSAAVLSGRTLKKGTHHIELEYFQGGGEAVLQLYLLKARKQKNGTVYLPKGDWLDPYTGKSYEGGKAVIRDFSLDETPLFVKRGTVSLLAPDSNNTKTQQWNRLTLDYYPSKKEKETTFLYEDDRETIAYQSGACRKMKVETCYEKEKLAFEVRLSKAEGDFHGADREKEITLKYHSLYDTPVESVLLNGREIPFTLNPRNLKASILSNEESAPDSDVVLATFTHQMTEEDIISIVLQQR